MLNSKKIVVSGYYGFKNFGDEAILSVLVNKLQESHKKITIITSDRQYTFSKFGNVKTIQTFDMKSIVLEILNSDMLISGGGSLLQDVTSVKSLFYYLFVIFCGILFGKKVVIFAQGIGPINNKYGKLLTKYLLKLCYKITVRDENSQNLLNFWGIKSELVNDPVFSYKIPVVEKEEVVGVQLRAFNTLSDEYLQNLANLVARNFSDKKIEIYSFQKELDLETCKKFKTYLLNENKNIKVELFQNLTDSKIISQFARLKYLIGMRYHSLIIGLKAGCKILAINYDIKVENLAKEFSIPMLNLEDLEEETFNKIHEVNTVQIQDKLKAKEFDWHIFL